MSRFFASVALVIALAAPTPAADPPAGSWKLTFRLNERPVMLLLTFAQADGKWTGEIADATVQFNKDPKFDSVAVAGNTLKFTLSVDKQPFVTFDGVVLKDGKKINGSLSIGGAPLELTDLRPSTLKKLADPFEVMKETLSQSDDAQTVFDSSIIILGQATGKKMKPEEARGIVDRATKMAADYGPRWERTAALRFATVLADQAGFADIALAQARKAERLLTDEDEATVRIEVLETLMRTLTKASKPEDAKKYEVQIQRLEARDYQDYGKTFPPFKADEFKGRKAKTDRVALVEIFSSTELPPTAAFESARDALLKSYKPTDVIVLTYHINISAGLDVMANKGSQDRLEFYANAIQRGTLSFVDGKRAVALQKETTVAASKAIFDALKEKIDDDLEKPAGAKLTLAVTPGEKGFTGKATVADLEKPGEQTFLRFAVVEDRVRYTASNGVRYHHNVVRAMPGGKGFVLKNKTAEQTVTVDPVELRESITKFLDELTKDAESPHGDRPLALKNLKLVAFIQNDSTGDIVAATQVELAATKKE
ncbi:hypothetical protein [Limnoglobus roseus]|uniref:Uncharacterized protein n=1 Tax=Limnoglobus roseus TaxID=2598579 RepID=A0A5C1AM65_9BACT|nr:hypothetical protein [Limnoglobus roseus]QEL17998.1 hypothetical protein PX52LOC_05012 [Limnoglobus roseus]